MKCSICGKQIVGKDIHNASPVTIGACCGQCNLNTVVPARIRAASGELKEYKGIVLTKNTVFEAFGQDFKVLDVVSPYGDVLCITTLPWRKTYFDDDIARDCTNNFNRASISRMLTYVFLAGLINTTADRELFRIMNTDIYDNFGERDYDFHRGRVRLLTKTEFIKYQDSLDFRELAWTMTPYRCKKFVPQFGDQSLSVVDTRGRYGHKKAFEVSDVYPVVTLSQKITHHDSFLLRRTKK